MLMDAWMKKRNTMLSENAERRRRLLDNLQKQLDEVIFFWVLTTHPYVIFLSVFLLIFFNVFVYCHQAVLDMQLYEKSLDVFEDDPATSVSCYSHYLHKIDCHPINQYHLLMVESSFLFPGNPTQASAKNYGCSCSWQNFAYTGNLNACLQLHNFERILCYTLCFSFLSFALHL